MNITIKKKPFRRKYIITTVLIPLLIIAVLIFILRTQEQKPDPASEAVIRAEVAAQLNKDPNELTDEDFTLFTEFEFDMFRSPVQLPKIVTINGKKRSVWLELTDIKIFEKFTNLQSLHLNNIAYPDRNIPKWMKFATKFGFIDLADRFSIDLNPLKKLHSLHTLTFGQVPVKNIKPLSSLTNLETLCLDSTEVCDLGPIKNLTKLKFLHVGHTEISDLEAIKGLTNLEKLIITGTKISDLEPVKSLPNLQRLWLEMCDNITDEQVEDLQKALPNLKITR
ncbi:MAG: hypothetical protein JXA96_11115 [Sedimentisphaerales bacterium]|nr:hypothetical protein [Sedimentisphaerales bacterium]